MKPLATLTLLIIALLIPLTVQAQYLEYVSSTLWSGANDIKVVGPYAYCAYANGLVIFDISDPADPFMYSQTYCQGKGMRLDISGNYAYLADSIGGLQIIDISDIFRPTIVGRYSTSGPANDVFLSGNYAYIAADSCGLEIINITDPANPILTGVFPLADNYRASAVYLAGNYAFLGIDQYSTICFCEIINVADPSNPYTTGRTEYLGSAVGAIRIVGNFAYIVTVDGYPLNESFFYIFNIINPAEPLQISSSMMPTSFQKSNLFIRGDFAFIVTDSELGIWDITDRQRPNWVAWHRGNLMTAVCVVDNYAFLTQRAGLQIVDISDPSVPVLIGNFGPYHDVYNVAIEGSYAVLANGRSYDLAMVDISDLANPAPVSSCSLSHPLYGLAVNSNHAYVAYYAGGLQIVNIANPESTYIEGALPIGGRLFNAAISGNYVYLPGYDSGLMIIDVSDPANPVLTGEIDTGDNAAYDVCVAGHYAYIAGNSGRGNSSFKIIDVSNPRAPMLINEMFLSADFLGVDVSGNYAYVSGASHFNVIDISNPADPVVAGTLNSEGYSFDVQISGNYAYVTDYIFGIKVIDISDPANPTVISNYYLPGNATNIFIQNGLCFVAADYSLMILRISPTSIDNADNSPSGFSLSRNYPNPFNAQTTISYSLAQNGPVNITVYNLLGQKVTTLFNGIAPAGEHKLVWDASSFPSGIYFARMETPKLPQNIKMILLK